MEEILQKFKKTSLAWELRRLTDLLKSVSPEHTAERQFYASLVPRGEGSIIDVGASHGSKTELFRHLAPRVVAIEPDPFAADMLRQRFRWRSNVVVHECAVTDKTGHISFYQFSPGSAFNTADPNWVSAMTDGSNHMHVILAPPQQIQVAACTVDEIATRYWPIKYLKIDAEGNEEKVLSTLRHQIPLVSLEFNFPQMHHSFLKCLQHLESLGNYQFNVAITEPPARLELDWLCASAVIEAIRARQWGYIELYARLVC